MTPDDLDWPPPVCDACGGDPDQPVTHKCQPIPWCSCIDCPWLYDPIPQPWEGA